jgi:hypothetical protein
MSDDPNTSTNPTPPPPEAASPWTSEQGEPVDQVSKDNRGVTFKADRHFPKLDSRGRWVNRRTDRLKARASDPLPKPPKEPARNDPPPPVFDDIKDILGHDVSQGPQPGGQGSEIPFPGVQVRDKYTVAAIGTVSGVTSAAIMVLGAHVKPTAEQTSAMVDAYETCYRQYGYAPSTPPWFGPVLATAAWIGPHMSDDKTISRVGKIRQMVAAVPAWWKSKKLGWAARRSRKDAEKSGSETVEGSQ